MLRHLLESQPRRTRTRSAAVVSLLIHASIVGSAVAATRTIVVPPPAEDPRQPIIYVTPRTPEPAPPRPADPRPARTDPAPAPSPTPPVIAPTDVPSAIPAPDPDPAPWTEPTFLPTNPGGSSGGEPGAGDPNATGPGSEPRWADEVEKAARPLGRQREPRYPDVLRAQRVEGRVVVAYVVDSLGRVEPNSIKVVESAHALFEPAVRQAVLATRFKPAEWRGHTVRQLVQQAFVFTLR